MSKIFTVSKATFDDASVLISDGTNQTAIYAVEGVSTIQEFLAAVDVLAWDENYLETFKAPIFQDMEGETLGTFEVPYITTT